MEGECCTVQCMYSTVQYSTVPADWSVCDWRETKRGPGWRRQEFGEKDANYSSIGQTGLDAR